MRNENFQISIVIPVYNEGDSLSACLKAINELTTKPYEVIVVDNNSNDQTRDIASSFSFVRLISESKQGVVHARSSGFDAARGDIFARIDADTLLYDGWIDQIVSLFNNNPELAAVSGPPDYYDIKLTKTANQIDHQIRKFLAKHLSKHLFLYGSNMAIRNTAWTGVKDTLCAKNGIHEDIDLAIHLQLEGYKVAYDDQLVAGVSIRRVGGSFSDYVRYSLVSPRSYSVHGLRYLRFIYPVVILCWVLYAPAHLFFLGYDRVTDSFSLRTFWLNSHRPARADPTTNVS